MTPTISQSPQWNSQQGREKETKPTSRSFLVPPFRGWEQHKPLTATFPASITPKPNSKTSFTSAPSPITLDSLWPYATLQSLATHAMIMQPSSIWLEEGGFSCSSNKTKAWIWQHPKPPRGIKQASSNFSTTSWFPGSMAGWWCHCNLSTTSSTLTIWHRGQLSTPRRCRLLGMSTRSVMCRLTMIPVCSV